MKLLLYCTKSKTKLYKTEKGFVLSSFPLGERYKQQELLNGKIVAECDFKPRKLIKISYPEIANLDEYRYHFVGENRDSFEKKSCLSQEEICKFLKNKDGYAIYIDNLKIYDKSKELNDFSVEEQSCKEYFKERSIDFFRVIIVSHYIESDKYIFISVHPEDLQKILNGKKTIHVIKNALTKVLKEKLS